MLFICILLKTDQKATYLIKHKHKTYYDYLQRFRQQQNITDRGQHFQQSIKLTDTVSSIQYDLYKSIILIYQCMSQVYFYIKKQVAKQCAF